MALEKGHSTIDGTLDLTCNIIKANEDKKIVWSTIYRSIQGIYLIPLIMAYSCIKWDIMV